MTAKIIWKRRKAAFRYPLGATPRTAILVNWFDVPKSFAQKSMASLRASQPLSLQSPPIHSGDTRWVRIFASGWSSEVQEFAPEAIVATSAQLVELAQSPAGLGMGLTHAVISVGRLGEALLTQSQRDLLWLAFQVPVFEQIIGPRGVLLAAECEAHNGLHDQTRLNAGAAANNDMAWRGFTIDATPCACGQSSPRLHVKPVLKVRAASAGR